jgi:hypothetical protein
MKAGTGEIISNEKESNIIEDHEEDEETKKINQNNIEKEEITLNNKVN